MKTKYRKMRVKKAHKMFLKDSGDILIRHDRKDGIVKEVLWSKGNIIRVSGQMMKEFLHHLDAFRFYPYPDKVTILAYDFYNDIWYIKLIRKAKEKARRKKQ